MADFYASGRRGSRVPPALYRRALPSAPIPFPAPSRGRSGVNPAKLWNRAIGVCFLACLVLFSRAFVVNEEVPGARQVSEEIYFRKVAALAGCNSDFEDQTPRVARPRLSVNRTGDPDGQTQNQAPGHGRDADNELDRCEPYSEAQLQWTSVPVKGERPQPRLEESANTTPFLDRAQGTGITEPLWLEPPPLPLDILEDDGQIFALKVWLRPENGSAGSVPLSVYDREFCQGSAGIRCQYDE